MEMVAEEGCSGGGGYCMLANDRGGASAGAAPVDLPRPQDNAAETNDTPAEQPCKHFSIRGYVSLVRKKNPKFCSLPQIFHGQQQYDECPNSLYQFPVTKFRPWDCSECSDKAEIPDHRIASGTVSMNQNGRSGGCSISLVGSALVPTSVDFRSLFPCTQQLPQGESAQRSTLLKNNPESNSKCNSHSGPETNTDPPMKGNAFVDATALPEVPEMRGNKEHGIAIPSSPKLAEVTLKSNAEGTGTPEVLTVDSDTDNPKSLSRHNGDQVCNSGPCEEIDPKRSARSNCKKKKSGKPTSVVEVLDVKNGRRKQRKVRLLSEIMNTDQVADSRSDNEVDHEDDNEVDHEDAAHLCEDDRRPVDVIPVSHQAVGEMVSALTKNKKKCKGVDDGSSLMKCMRRVHKKLRSDKKDSETQQDDENIRDNNLQRNVQSTDDMSQMEPENYSQRSLSTTDAQHDDFIPVSHLQVGKILTETGKSKTKCKGVDVVDEGSSVKNWPMKRIPKKSRTRRKAIDSFAVNSKSNLDRVASKDVRSDFVSSTNTQQGDEILENNLERNVQNTYDISKNVKAISLSKRNISSTANAEHGDVDENVAGKRVVLRTDDQCHVECSSSVQQHLAKVSPVKRGIHSMPSLEQGQHKKRKKQKLAAVHEKHAALEGIPMDIVELLAKNQGERLSITEADCSDFSSTRITDDEECTIIIVEDGQNYASTVPSCTSQQNHLTSQSNQKVLQDQVACTRQVSSTHQLDLQMDGHLNSAQDQQTHLRMGEVVTIAASSPLISQDKDQSIAEPPADRSSHERAKKLMWDSFNAAPRDSASAATSGARFRSSIEAVNVTSTHVAGAYSGHLTHQLVYPTVDYYTNRAVNQVHARSFRSTISTMEESGNLHDRTNGGQPDFYSEEIMHATHLLSPADPSRLAGFPNFEESYRNQMGLPLRNPCYAHNQYRGSASTSHGSNLNGYLYRGSASTSHGSNLNENQYRGSASTSHGSNVNAKVPLTLEDLSRHRLQPGLHIELQTLRPIRPLPRVGVLSSLLQKEITNLSDNHGAQSGLRIGVSRGIPLLDINRRENVDAFNSETFSERLTAPRLGYASAGLGYLSVRNSTAQSWTRGQEKPNDMLDRLVRKDICVVNKNPSDFSVITDDNEYVRDDLIRRGFP